MRARACLLRLVNVFRRSRLDRDLQEQLDAHRGLIAADLIHRGMAPADAAAAARRALGSDLLIRERSGDQMVLRWLDGLLWDVRQAVTGLRRSPGFAAGAALTLALGIGVNVAVFSAVDRVLFRPLPYADPDRLFVMAQVSPTGEAFGTLPAGYVVEARRSHAGLADLGVSLGPAVGYTGSPDPDAPPLMRAAPVSFNALRVLGVTPVLGRDFTEDDAREGRALVLIRFETWQAAFGGDPQVIGRTLWRGGSEPAEIVGVLPRGFVSPPNQFAPRPDGLALASTLIDSAEPRDRSSPPYVRLAPGVSVATAETELAVIADRAHRSGLATATTTPAPLRLIPVRDFLFGRYGAYARLVFGAASLVLLVACANLASLVLVRGRSRERLAATRMALGASPGRLMRAAAIESLCLAAAGAAVALVALLWSLEGLRALLPPTFTDHAVPILDTRVLVFSLLVACATAVTVSVLPAWRLARLDVRPLIQGTTGSGRPRRAGGATLLVIETALGVVLVAGAVAASRSLVGLMWTDLGFDPDGLYQVTFTVPTDGEAEARFERYARVLEVIQDFPGVQSASGANVQPISGAAGWTSLGGDFGSVRRAFRSHVTAGHFETIRQPLLAGQTITARDVQTRARVGVLNLSGLRLVWPGVEPREAIGRRLEFDGEAPIEVIGVVSDLRPQYASTPDAYLYMPITPDDMRFMMYAVRTEGGRPLASQVLRDHLEAEAGPVTGMSVGRITDWLHESLHDQRFRAVLFSLFGIVSLVLAAVGLYAVCAFEVAARRHELGIRVALGATAARLRRLVLAEALWPATIGVAAGLALACWAAALLQSFLHEIDARDPWTLALVSAALLVTAAAAAWIPARRAARTDPARVLRAI